MNTIDLPKFTKDELKSKLAEGKWEVTFIKKDGTSRTIICTRDTNLIPKELRDTLAEGYKAKRKETAAIPVWELNLAEWRSFTSEQVTDIRFCK